MTKLNFYVILKKVGTLKKEYNMQKIHYHMHMLAAFVAAGIALLSPDWGTKATAALIALIAYGYAMSYKKMTMRELAF